MSAGETQTRKIGWGGCSPSELHYAAFSSLIQEATGNALHSIWAPNTGVTDQTPVKVYVTRSDDGNIEAILHDGMDFPEHREARKWVLGAWEEAKIAAVIAVANTVEILPLAPVAPSELQLVG